MYLGGADFTGTNLSEMHMAVFDVYPGIKYPGIKIPWYAHTRVPGYGRLKTSQYLQVQPCSLKKEMLCKSVCIKIKMLTPPARWNFHQCVRQNAN
eukprot:725552-Rhodomonas_salina.2